MSILSFSNLDAARASCSALYLRRKLFACSSRIPEPALLVAKGATILHGSGFETFFTKEIHICPHRAILEAAGHALPVGIRAPAKETGKAGRTC